MESLEQNKSEENLEKLKPICLDAFRLSNALKKWNSSSSKKLRSYIRNKVP